MLRQVVLLLIALHWCLIPTLAAPAFSDQPAVSDTLVRDGRFDYVVVGGGTAGIVVATRLAQKSYTVALIEAGGFYEYQSLNAIPLADFIPVGSDPQNKFTIDWGFVTRNQPGVNNRSIHYARGKCLGGSSALNFMIYQRPTRDSMKQWAAAVGDSSYTFDRVLPYFKRSVHFTPPNQLTRFPNSTPSFDPAAYDPQGGPLHASYSNYAMTFSSWMRLAMNSIGIQDRDEFNLGSLMGAQYCTSTIRPRDQKRSSSESSFLETKPPLLTTYTGKLGEFTLHANKEVLVSAGVFQSPQLLMVSGIGPAKTLDDHGIPVLADRPGVGQNMWDHPFFGPSYRVRMPTASTVVTNLPYLLTQAANAAIFRQGPFTNPLADYLAWEKIPNSLRANFSKKTMEDLARFPRDWPEAEYVSAAAYVGDVSKPVLLQPRDGYDYASIVGVLVAPTSRGNVTIRSADTADLPTINPNWLSTETDEEVAIATFKRIRQAFESDVMAPVLIGDEYYPGNRVQSNTEILEYVKDNMMTIWHAACTCKMGTAQDPMAVVDSQARVFGVDGLRVVDASAFPLLPPGHPQSVVYMLAEKISDAILSANGTARRR
ncbi:glucose-methanol-choline (gmc) oxidoreductase [Aspergillus bombycis]|uniref:Glucose-methanol-choline (Gmc) oxidoreductase n=1 Tax=Aspergillus bombycis TaxID=109264 RepID=A0A1F7ZS95_9EURO|nr:glucose-methanol-choline (gmc) oxidoreductase [Aspergillus bombycis]OGM42312.1 glucose-methanol-choline (gmc) oxidoreductase [Aspergillus bombycis]